MDPLTKIAEKYFVDKCPKFHHYYTPEYHEILKDKNYSSMLEIGIGYPELMCKYTTENYRSGASLFMWKEYFKDCTIHGVDIKSFDINEKNINIHQMDQSSQKSMIEIMSKIGNVDFIIDDGSHIYEHQVLSFKTLWKYINDIYIIEDVRPENIDKIQYLENEFSDCKCIRKFKHENDTQGFVCFQKIKKLPKILYINLDSRTDRKKEMEKILQGYNYERISAIQHDDGYIGCSLSHIKCIEIARIRKYEKVIILEDDFMFNKNHNFNNIELPENYDIFLLCNRIKSHLSINDRKIKKDKFIKVQECSWTSGHILNKTIYDDLIKNLNDGINDRKKNGKLHSNKLDIYWNKLWKNEGYKCLSHNFVFATQKSGFSDILNLDTCHTENQCRESKFY